MLLPVTAYNGIDAEYLKKGNNLNNVRSKYEYFVLLPIRISNMISMIGSLMAIFFFSVSEPNWEYNWKVLTAGFSSQ